MLMPSLCPPSGLVPKPEMTRPFTGQRKLPPAMGSGLGSCVVLATFCCVGAGAACRDDQLLADLERVGADVVADQDGFLVATELLGNAVRRVAGLHGVGPTPRPGETAY